MYNKVVIVGITFMVMMMGGFGESRVVNDCAIYEEVLKFLDRVWEHVRYFYVVPNPYLDSGVVEVVVRDKYRWKFLIIDKTNPLHSGHVRSWFAEIVRDSSLIHKRFFSLESGKPIGGCVFKEVAYQFCGSCFLESIWHSEQRVIDSDTIRYVPLCIRFSRVLYSSDGLALVSVQYTARRLSGFFDWHHCFVFQYVDGNWVLRREGRVVM